MNDYLVFRLSAPMGSFGSFSGHERRSTDNFPLRSAILGILGAALGIERSDLNSQNKLLDYHVAIFTKSLGSTFRDFHTIQSIPSTIKKPNSRRSAIESIGNGIKTSITKRDYFTEIDLLISIWSFNGHWTLNDLVQSLKNPKFFLYVGRKSCPLAAPMNPRIVKASDPVESFDEVLVKEEELPSGVFPIVSDPFPEGEPDRREIVPSEPIDRGRWHFEQKERWYFDRKNK